jgi:hypothetical protein
MCLGDGFLFTTSTSRQSAIAIDGEITDLGWHARPSRGRLKDHGNNFQGVVKPFSIVDLSRVIRWEQYMICQIKSVVSCVGLSSHLPVVIDGLAFDPSNNVAP